MQKCTPYWNWSCWYTSPGFQKNQTWKLLKALLKVRQPTQPVNHKLKMKGDLPGKDKKSVLLSAGNWLLIKLSRTVKITDSLFEWDDKKKKEKIKKKNSLIKIWCWGKKEEGKEKYNYALLHQPGTSMTQFIDESTTFQNDELHF